MGRLLHAARLVGSLLRESAKAGGPVGFLLGLEPRSPLWPGVRRKFLEAHPTCAACGASRTQQVHHCAPFHLDPALELDPANLITLCMTRERECHLMVGHSGDAGGWRHYNPFVRRDAAEMLRTPGKRGIIVAAIRSYMRPL